MWFLEKIILDTDCAGLDKIMQIESVPLSLLFKREKNLTLRSPFHVIDMNCRNRLKVEVLFVSPMFCILNISLLH